MRFKDLLEIRSSKPTEEIEAENEFDIAGKTTPTPDLSGFEKILYPGRDLETLTDDEIEELELSDWGKSLVIPEDEADDLELSEGSEYLFERIIKKKVIRNGKRLIKYTTDKEGYRVSKVGGRVREVRMKAQEMRRRMRGQKIAARKRKSKSKVSQRKRSKSMLRRKSFGG